jgi:hypothetical protein
MTPLDKCMQTLSTLVRINDPGGAELMEAAVASLLKAVGPGTEARIAALDALVTAVRSLGRDTEFTALILDYIAQQRDGLVDDLPSSLPTLSADVRRCRFGRNPSG